MLSKTIALLLCVRIGGDFGSRENERTRLLQSDADPRSVSKLAERVESMKQIKANLTIDMELRKIELEKIVQELKTATEQQHEYVETLKAEGLKGFIQQKRAGLEQAAQLLEKEIKAKNKWTKGEGKEQAVYPKEGDDMEEKGSYLEDVKEKMEVLQKKLGDEMKWDFKQCAASAVMATIFDSVDHAYILCATKCNSTRRRITTWPAEFTSKISIFDGKENDKRVLADPVNAKNKNLKGGKNHYLMATRAHYDIVLGAHKAGHKTILVLEEDVLFRRDMDEGWSAGDLQQLKNFIQSSNLNILRLGYFPFFYSTMDPYPFGTWMQWTGHPVYTCVPICKCKMVGKHICETPVGCDIRNSEAYVVSTAVHPQMLEMWNTNQVIDMWMFEERASQVLVPMIASQDSWALDREPVSALFFADACAPGAAATEQHRYLFNESSRGESSNKALGIEPSKLQCKYF